MMLSQAEKGRDKCSGEDFSNIFASFQIKLYFAFACIYKKIILDFPLKGKKRSHSS